MSASIRITRVPYEEPHHLNLQVEVSNGRQRFCFEYYSNASDLTDIAKNLSAFPRHASDVYLYELGSERPEDRWAYYFRLRAFTISGTGHCAMQFRFNNNQELPDHEEFEFCLKAEPAQINRLGKLFSEFAALKHDVLEWSGNDGSLSNHANAA